MSAVQTYECGNCGAKLDPSADKATMRCTFCGTITERSRPAATPSPAAARAPVDEPRAEKPKKARDWGDLYVPLYLGSIGLVVAAGLAYEYLYPKRSVTGRPLVADVTGDGVDDLVVQWDEDVWGAMTHVVGLVDGRSQRVVWKYVLDPKHHAGEAAMAIGSNYVVVGEAKPVADILDLKTGALKLAVDLPEVASYAYAYGASVWIDAQGWAVTVDVAGRQISPAKSTSALDADRPVWAPYDAGQKCPKATCRSSSAASVADMSVSSVYLDPGTDDAVAVGQKATGTHLPMIAGVSLSRKTTRWSRVLTADAASSIRAVIAHDRVYFEYSDGSAMHLACA